MNELEVMRYSLIQNGFNKKFVEGLNPFALATLYDLWDVEDDGEREINVEAFLDEYGFSRKEALQ